VFLRGLQIVAVFWRYAVIPTLLRRRDPPGPVRLRLALQQLGGAWIKLGQALALRFDLLPEAYCLELFKLLNAVDPFPWEEVRRTIREELGEEPEVLYASFDHQSFAAASIGQVHRATLHSGEEVAVKVQRPGVRRQIRRDVKLMYFGASLLDWTHVFGATPARQVVDEFARWTVQELDFRSEARAAFNLGENADGDPIEHEPTIYFELTGPRVLTMELIEGVPLIDVIQAVRNHDSAFLDEFEGNGHVLDRIAYHVCWNVLNQIYRQGYFHADLHPANLFVLENDGIAYVDFGIVGTVSGEIRESLVHYAWNLYQGNIDRAVDEFMRWIRPSERTDVVGARNALIQLLDEYLFSIRRVDGRTLTFGSSRRNGDRNTMGPEGGSFEIEMLRLVRAYGMSVSPDVVAYFKALVTANAVIFELDPEFDLAAVENRFYGTMILQDMDDLRSFRNFSSFVFEYVYRVTRALDILDQTESAEADVEAYVGRIWRRIQVLAVLAAILVFAFFVPQVRHEIQQRAWLYYGLAVVFVLLILGIIHQGRRLRTRVTPVRGFPRAIAQRDRDTSQVVQ
jgi:ubiquinone biosynthesis protein